MTEVLRPRTIGDLLGQTLTLFFSGFWKLLLIQVLFWVTIAALIGLALLAFILMMQAIGGDGEEKDLFLGLLGLGGLAYVGLLIWFLSPLPAAASVLAVADEFTGETTPIGACYAVAIRRILPLFLITFLLGLVYFGGLCMLCIPFFFFFTKFFVAIPVMMLERKGIGDSLGRSWQLTEGLFGQTLGYVMTIWAIGVGFSYVSNVALTLPFAFSESIVLRTATDVLGRMVGNIVPAMLTAVAQVAMYFDLRTRKEALDLQTLIGLVDEIGPLAPEGGAGIR